MVFTQLTTFRVQSHPCDTELETTVPRSYPFSLSSSARAPTSLSMSDAVL